MVGPMWTSLQTELKRPLPMSLAALAALGWIILIIYAVSASSERQELTSRIGALETDRNQLADEFAAHQEANRSYDAILQDIESTQSELDAVETRRQQAEVKATEQEARLSELQSTIAAGQEELATAQADLQDARQQSETVKQELSQSGNDLAVASEQLVEVGARLEEARATEAALLQSVADLTEQASDQTGQLAEVEERLQDARAAEATMQQAVAEARSAVAELEERQEFLESSVATQEEQQAALMDEITRAEDQRLALQAQVTQLATALAERSQQMADLETRFESLQADTSAAARVSATGLVPGRYVGFSPSAPTRLIDTRFGADGTFEMGPGGNQGPGAARRITGQYQLDDNQLVLSGVQGDTGSATFPMSCMIEARVASFAVLDVQTGEGCLLAGITFRRTE
jgi:predicted  nucleic acid-binding Zn-ribbon protein